MDKSRIASRLKPPSASSSSRLFTALPVLKDISNTTTTTSLIRKPVGSGTSTSTNSTQIRRKTRRSKSFGVSTFKATQNITSKLKTTATKPVTKNQNITNVQRKAITPRLNNAVTRATTTVQIGKTAVKRPAATEIVKPPVSAPKLSKYDYKGRFAVLDEKHKTLIINYKEAKSRLDILESENVNLLARAEEQAELIEELQEYKVSTEELIISLKQTEEKFVKSEKHSLFLKESLDKTKEKLSVLQVDHAVLNHNYEEIKSQNTTIEEALQELRNNHDLVQEELHKLKTDFTFLQKRCLAVENENTQLKYDWTNAQKSIEEYKCFIREHETLRRRLHNDIQDLKGNIRVFCRVRPINPDEEDRIPCNMEFVDESTLELKKCRESLMSREKGETKLEFVFDKVFPGESTQAEVFEDLSQLVQSTLDGYNVCVFAYGQTGSGKTFTMLGNSEDLGMIPRSVDLLFNKIAELEKLGWSYEVQVNFIEIYNETIKDLLNPESKKAHEIMHNDGKGTVVTNLCTESVSTALKLKELMIKANDNRAIAATNFNLHSSRSHAVTKITVRGYLEQSEFIGSLNLVDLAGSESAKNSERMNETKNINKSLSALGTVMLALHNKDKHVPYRNSKLTYLLQSSLGGNSKTLMFVNISPLDDCYSESVNSLRFASKVKEVKTGSKRNRAIMRNLP